MKPYKLDSLSDEEKERQMAEIGPEKPKVGLDRSKTGRKKGTPNKTTALLKDAILQAAELAGEPDGLVGYLKVQAKDNPGPFLALLGKVLPMQITGDKDSPLQVVVCKFTGDD